MDAPCNHQWRALPDVMADHDKGLVASVYCFQCGYSSYAQLKLIGREL